MCCQASSLTAPALKGENMSVIQMAQRIKQIHPNYVLIFEVGTFCNTYGRDSYIISANFDYSLKAKGNVPICGFPKKALR